MEPEVPPVLQGISEVVFQQEILRAHVALNLEDYYHGRHARLLPWSAFLTDMPLIEYGWDYIGRRHPHTARQVQSTTRYWHQIEAI